MIHYMKRVAQVVVLTVVLVFGALLVTNSGVITRDVEAYNHNTENHHWYENEDRCDDITYPYYEYYSD